MPDVTKQDERLAQRHNGRFGKLANSSTAKKLVIHYIHDHRHEYITALL